MEISRVKDSLEHLRVAAIEVAHGCGMANEISPTTEDVGLLVAALHEMHGAAERLLKSMQIDKDQDHDGDTQPNNERPEQPMRCGFVAVSADGSSELVCQRELRHEGPHYSGPVAAMPPPSEPWWMADPPKCQCGHGRDVHGPAGPATPSQGLVCYMIDCPCKAFAKC